MFLKLSVLILVAVCSAALASPCEEVDPEGYDNLWEEELNFECADKDVLSDIHSIHSIKQNDRKFKLGCRQAPSGATPGVCRWTEDFVNTWEEPVMFMCEPNEVIAGVKSEFRKKSLDRRMSFKCCHDSAVLTSACSLTEYLNEYEQEMTYEVPNGQILAGWFSVFSDKKGDRRHKMLECRYRP